MKVGGVKQFFVVRGWLFVAVLSDAHLMSIKHNWNMKLEVQVTQIAIMCLLIELDDELLHTLVRIIIHQVRMHYPNSKSKKE